MTSANEELLVAFELHSVDRINAALDGGVDVRVPVRDKSLVDWALFALGYLAAAFFPCEPGCRPTQPTLSQAMHNLLGLAGYVSAPLSLFALGWQARGWTKATHLSALGFIGGGLALVSLLLLSPDFRYVGVAQRVLEGSVLAWVVVSALYINNSSPATSTKIA